jgi:hypothetical protein
MSLLGLGLAWGYTTTHGSGTGNGTVASTSQLLPNGIQVTQLGQATIPASLSGSANVFVRLSNTNGTAVRVPKLKVTVTAIYDADHVEMWPQNFSDIHPPDAQGNSSCVPDDFTVTSTTGPLNVRGHSFADWSGRIALDTTQDHNQDACLDAGLDLDFAMATN